jgi:hypothetical protein
MLRIASFTQRQSIRMNPVKPVAKQKHFLVSRVIARELPTDPIEWVQIEAVFSKSHPIHGLA